MNSNILGILVSIIFIFIIIAMSTALTSKNIISGEGSRKFIHIGVSNWWIIAMIYFNSPIYAAIVPGLFIVINYISYKKQVFKAMERDGSKKDLGTVYYAVSLFVLSVVTFSQGFNPYIGALGILVMGYGDGLAAVIGSKYGNHKITVHNSTKSLEGSVTMFITSFITIFILLSIFDDYYKLAVSLILAVVSAILELVTPEGFDNITVPLGTSFLYMVIVAII